MLSHVHVILVPSDADGLRRTVADLHRVLHGLCRYPCQGHRPFVAGTPLFGGVMVTGCAPAPMPGKRMVPGQDQRMWNANLTMHVSWAALRIQPFLPPIVLWMRIVFNEIQVADCWPATSFSGSRSHPLFRKSTSVGFAGRCVFSSYNTMEKSNKFCFGSPGSRVRAPF